MFGQPSTSSQRLYVEAWDGGDFCLKRGAGLGEASNIVDDVNGSIRLVCVAVFCVLHVSSLSPPFVWALLFVRCG